MLPKGSCGQPSLLSEPFQPAALWLLDVTAHSRRGALGTLMDARLCVAAASQGSVDTLIALRSQRPASAWNQQTCTAAARSGHLPVLRYLRSCNPPCPWSAEVCTAAAAAGHLAILQWARLHGCSWNADTFEQAWENRSAAPSPFMMVSDRHMIATCN